MYEGDPCNSVLVPQCQSRCDEESNFRCRGYSLRPPEPGRGVAWVCILHGDDTVSASPSALLPLPGALYAERAACIDRKRREKEKNSLLALEPATFAL